MQKNYCDKCEKDITKADEWYNFSSFKMINDTKDVKNGRDLIQHKALTLCVECGEPKQKELYEGIEIS